MVIVTHELAFAREVSTRAAFMHRGMIEEESSPQEFFSSPLSGRLRSFLFRASINGFADERFRDAVRRRTERRQSCLL